MKKDNKNLNSHNSAKIQPQKIDTLTGIVDKILFTAPDTGYTVARLRVEKTDESVTVTLNIPLQLGQKGEFTGRWIQHKKYGRQFQAENFCMEEITNPEGIEKYLSSGIIKGIGKEVARRIVEKFGPAALRVMEREPERLKEVKGIGNSRLQQIRQIWGEQRGRMNALVFLQAHGIGPLRALKIFKKYGENTIEMVKENPYRLASEVWGIGFSIADNVARSFGFDLNSPERAKAGIIFALQKASGEGDCYVTPEQLHKICLKELNIPENLIGQSLKKLQSEGEIFTGPGEIYLRYYALCEEKSARYLYDIYSTPPAKNIFNREKSIRRAADSQNFQLSLEQKQALRTTLSSKISIITGGPGVGKTTILRALVEILKNENLSFTLASPTGRAAKRMAESVGSEASTVHRLLKFRPGDGEFQLNRKNPLPYDWLIIDEMSMVDISLFYSLLSAVRPESNILLVGDKDQLPSVGPGRVLEDLIESGTIPVTFLTKIYRQKEGSLIIENTHRVNQGLMPILTHQNENKLSDFYFIPCEEPEKIEEKLIQTVTERIPQRFHLDPLREIQVISPMQKRALGAESLNLSLQKVLNHQEGETEGFRVGDKVIQLKNNYDKEIFNGDMGYITSVDTEREIFRINFDGNDIDYDFADMDEIRLAYACTVHKSQGAEFPAVVMPLYMGHYILLQRNLLYTALSRAKSLVVLIGSKKALFMATKNNRISKRNTGLKGKIEEVFRGKKPNNL